MGQVESIVESLKEIVTMEEAKSLIGRAIDFFTQSNDCDYYERKNYEKESLGCQVNRLTRPLWHAIIILGVISLFAILYWIVACYIFTSKQLTSVRTVANRINNVNNIEMSTRAIQAGPSRRAGVSRQLSGSSAGQPLTQKGAFIINVDEEKQKDQDNW